MTHIPVNPKLWTGGSVSPEETVRRIRATTNRRRTVFCTLQFEGFHRWPEAPPTVEHLFNLHRHVFHVRVDFDIQEDREIEFIQAKSVIADFIAQLQRGGEGAAGQLVDLDELQTWSCETWALEILDKFTSWGAFKVEVSEDGENGAVVYL